MSITPLNQVDFLVKAALNIKVHPFLGKLVAPRQYLNEGVLDNQPGICIAATNNKTKGMAEHHIWRELPKQVPEIGDIPSIVIDDAENMISLGNVIDIDGWAIIKDSKGIHSRNRILKATDRGLCLVRFLLKGVAVDVWLASPAKEPEEPFPSVGRGRGKTGYRPRPFYLSLTEKSGSSPGSAFKDSVFDRVRRNPISLQDWDLKQTWTFFDVVDHEQTDERIVWPVQTQELLEGHPQRLAPSIPNSNREI